jgi:phosphoglycerate dehydrogenase-like enzyme
MPCPAHILTVEDDGFLRVVGIILDPATAPERVAAYADFFAHDEPDFAGYLARARRRAGALFPAEVRFVNTQEEMRAALPGCRGLIVESLAVGPDELAAGDALRVVQKYGARLRYIDAAACAARGIEVRTLRRRANVACAEVAFALMLTLAKKLNRLLNRISPERLGALGYRIRPFDSRHTPNGNWARIPGIGMLNGATIGIIGLGEIGAEIALRAAAFGMRVLYTQRTRLPEAEERELRASFAALETLLAESDWVIPQLPTSPATRHFLDRARLALMKPGACIVNVSRADLVERAALLDALRSGRLGGFGLDPLYEAPGREDDELLRFDNVMMSPHLGGSPRQNGLDDLADLVEQVAKALGY